MSSGVPCAVTGPMHGSLLSNSPMDGLKARNHSAQHRGKSTFRRITDSGFIAVWPPFRWRQRPVRWAAGCNSLWTRHASPSASIGSSRGDRYLSLLTMHLHCQLPPSTARSGHAPGKSHWPTSVPDRLPVRPRSAHRRTEASSDVLRRCLEGERTRPRNSPATGPALLGSAST